MNKNPKITVLMPVFNAERFLAEAIESILNQSFVDFEFLIIDDGSSDRSREIVRSYDDSRIRLVENERNLGISATLNRGIGLAESDLIARMDGDDISYPDRLKLQFEYMTQHPNVGMTSGQADTIDKEGTVVSRSRMDGDQVYFHLAFHCWVYHPSVMFRKEIVEQVGRYPAGYAEDFRLWSKLVRVTRIKTLADVLIQYRASEFGVSNGPQKGPHLDAEKLQMAENLCYYLGSNYRLPDAWLECYRDNLSPLLKRRDRVGELRACISEIDRITAAILSMENPNREAEAVIRARDSKKGAILNRALKKLSWRERFWLALSLGEFKVTLEVLRKATARMAWKSVRGKA